MAKKLPSRLQFFFYFTSHKYLLRIPPHTHTNTDKYTHIHTYIRTHTVKEKGFISSTERSLLTLQLGLVSSGLISRDKVAHKT